MIKLTNNEQVNFWKHVILVCLRSGHSGGAAVQKADYIIAELTVRTKDD